MVLCRGGVSFVQRGLRSPPVLHVRFSISEATHGFGNFGNPLSQARFHPSGC